MDESVEDNKISEEQFHNQHNDHISGQLFLGLMKDWFRDYIQSRSWNDLITGAVIGAVFGLILTSLATPILNPYVTNFYEGVGIYSAPPVDVDIENKGEFHPNGASITDYEDLEWKDEFSVYRIQIRNAGDIPVEQMEFVWRAPGCIVYSNTEGPTAGGDYTLSNRGTYGIFSNVSLEINRFQCTKVMEVIDGELSPEETITAEFVVTSTFEECDLLIDLNPRNLHLLTYTWEVDGVSFEEQRVENPSHLEDTYQAVQQTEFVGTRESLTLSSGTRIHSFVVGVRGDSMSDAVTKCANTSASS